MKFSSRLFLAIVASLAVISLPACATTYGEPIHGQVVEEGTNKPIPGAIVVARWQETRSAIGHGQTVCVHIETATTDEQGRYQLPRYNGRIPGLVDSYKPGYERSPLYFSTKAYEQHKDILKPFARSSGERLEQLMRLSSATRCGEAGTSEMNLLVLKKALYDEASAIASAKEDQDKVETLLFGLESLEFGSIEALNRMTERRRVKK